MYAFSIDVPQPVEAYEKVLAALREAGQDQPPERILHLAVPTEGGFRVTEVWESHEAVDRYGDEVMRPTIERIAGAEAVAGGPPPNQEFTMLGLQLRGDRLAP
jgi:quinol monooxygenase YgiN